ncbi:MAG: CHRD domain-containing protein, partial [Bacteroidota bacterium]|nr:CHRD domain-containing protein [Bacteroidota bacterium]MDX5430879.1 CHRD domain-containing protein [Bacteroidota bacterium]MDX5469624.1 CHRD domain-containing protein [Bacteroidota bacterium]
MKKLYILTLALVVSAVNSFAAHLGPQILFTAELNGSQEVPPVAGNATGVASFYLNATRDTLCVRASWHGLTGEASGVHIHSGAMGENGDVLVNLSNDISGNQIYARITGSDLTAGLITSLLSGNTYLNIHTAANLGGEIRGQIQVEADPGFYAYLTTSQETTPVMGSNAVGFAVMKASRNKKSLWIELIGDSLTATPSGAHIHYGAMGMSGGVILNLSSLIDGNRIAGTLEVTPGLIDTLMSGMAYINLHTTMNPGGEIRG